MFENSEKKIMMAIYKDAGKLLMEKEEQYRRATEENGEETVVRKDIIEKYEETKREKTNLKSSLIPEG